MSFLLTVYIINFIVLIVFVCFERKDPVVSMAWVLAFSVLPVIGFVIYLIFGTGLKRKTAKRYLEKWQNNLDLTERIERVNMSRRSVEYDEAYNDMIYYLANVNKSVLTDNNKVNIYTDAQAKYTDLLEDIRNAKETINLVYFIIRNDKISKQILNALTMKAKEGVEVRFLYDSIGCFTTNKYIFNRLREAGGKVTPFFPVKLTSYSKLNHRNHRKIVVIDGKIGYIGGMNIGEEYMGHKKLHPWRDTHIRVEGSAVTYLQKIFSLDWLFSTDEDLSTNINKYFPRYSDKPGNVKMQIVASGPDSTEEEIKCGMIKMINSAKKYIYIHTPYFIPDKTFISALKMAANSGVDVRLIIPGKPDKKSVYFTTYSFIGELLKEGIRVYKHKGFIHSKMMVVDSEIATIGTTNLDIRSFQLHFEVNAFLYDKSIATECKHDFERDITESKEITIDEYQNRKLIWQLLEGICRLFAPIM